MNLLNHHTFSSVCLPKTRSVGRSTRHKAISRIASCVRWTQGKATVYSCAMSFLVQLLTVFRALVGDRNRLVLENLALRQQLAVLRRSVNRPRLQDSDRIFWILLRRLLRNWRESLLIVNPETVVRWHRKGWRYYWRRKSQPKMLGRPPISFKLIHLIRKMSLQNVTWGAPRIQSELALLGHDVAESTVAKYMVKKSDPKRRQDWQTFLHNHLGSTIACDFFTVPSITFKRLFCFVVLSHARRRILHVGVTKNPTAEWTSQQLRRAVTNGLRAKYLIHDRDKTYGEAFHDEVEAHDLEEVLIGRRCPWQNGYVERVIGTIRRECTDHIIPFGETVPCKISADENQAAARQ